MQKQQITAFTMAGLILFSFVTPAQARAPKSARFKHADRNRDGAIDRKEWRMEKAWEEEQRVRVNTRWEKRADTNNDGLLDSAELSAWKKIEKERIDLNKDGVIDAKERRLCWRYLRSRVNTALENKFDSNQDGWLEPQEAREMLRYRYGIISRNGRARVDTEIERDYDANQNGMIDPEEAEELKSDLGL